MALDLILRTVGATVGPLTKVPKVGTIEASMYRAVITRVFSAAHAIRLADGSHEPLHGHNWEIQVTVGAEALNDIEVVMDFHDLAQLVDTVVAQAHNRNLNDIGPFAHDRSNPTAERVAWWIGSEVAKGLPAGVVLISTQVSEAPGCHAVYAPC